MIIENSSRNEISLAISRLHLHWDNGQWLSTNNRYRDEASEQVKNDANNGNFSHGDLIEYIAASTISHCFDGWTYLSRALEAELGADPNTARHLGYYAELRAAMSILACEGIGVFNRHHVAVMENGTCMSIPSSSGTHVFTWHALETWSSLPKSHNILLNAIKPAGVPFQEWIDIFGSSASILIDSWLKQWGLDIRRLSEDQESRNIASYRPSALKSNATNDVSSTINAVSHLWDMCEIEATGFSLLDRHLLRRSIEILFQGVTGRSRKQARKIYSEKIDEILSKHKLADTARRDLSKFLKFERFEEIPILIKLADSQDSPESMNHSMQVLSRATLLLRVATAMVERLLHDSGTTNRSLLEFWWASDAVRRRLWPATQPPNAFSDLWIDIEDALESVQNWTQESSTDNCHYSFWKDQAQSVSILTTPERVFLWSVFP